MAEYDLTWRIGAFLDRQLVFPLLEFLQHREVGFSGISESETMIDRPLLRSGGRAKSANDAIF